MKKIQCIVLFITLLLGFYALPLYADEYFVDATNGNDSNDGMTTISAWKYAPGMSLATGNAAFASLSPGDTIYFKMGQVWRDTLTINASGSEGNPITFAAKSDWGTGDNPRILSTEQVSSWKKVDATYNIWRATIPGKTYCYGMLNSAGTARVDAYQAKPSYANWSDQYFYGRTGDSYIYFKNDAGDPGPREVGKRLHGIYANSREYITIDGIDVYGPESNSGSSVGAKDKGPIHFHNCTNITVKNCQVAFSSGVGIGFTGSNSSNGTIQECAATDSWSGIWFENAGHTYRVSRCHVTNIAIRIGDTGDKDMIGAYLTDDIIVEDSYLDTSGNADYDENGNGITFSDCNGQIIRRNYIKNTSHSGILVGANDTAGSYGVQIYSNIIDSWGRLPGADRMWYDGIIIGGGGTASSTYGNVLVYNNLLINGPKVTTLWDQKGNNRGLLGNAGIRILNNKFRDVKVINNLFNNNDSIYEFTWDVSQYTGTRDISHNYFYRTSDDAIGVGVDWGRGTVYAYDNITLGPDNWQDIRSYAKNNYQISLNNNPQLTKTISGTYTLSADPSDIIKSGGRIIEGEDFKIAVHPDRVWTPFKKMNHLTTKQDDTYSIGPFGALDFKEKMTQFSLSPPAGFKLKIQ